MDTVSHPPTLAVDLLDQAMLMLDFLIDVAPAMANDGNHSQGLVENSVNGLGLIFRHIQQTIDHARGLI